jgi:hypothetical protein
VGSLFAGNAAVDHVLFSTICTTCHARIAVLREDAIGTIQGCPKCGGMVMIAPPEGWVSAHAVGLAAMGSAAASGPPPLTKVSQTFLTLDIEPEPPVAVWKTVLAEGLHSQVVWVGAAASAFCIAVLIWIFTSLAPSHANTALATNEPPKQAAKPAAEKAIPAVAEDGMARDIEKVENAAAKNPDENPPENKPAEVKVAEAKPESAVVDAKNDPQPLDNPPAAKPIEPKPAEPLPSGVEPAVAIDPPAAAVADARALPTLPAMPVENEIHPLPMNENVPLPVTAAKLIKQVPPVEIDVESRMDDVVPNLEMKETTFLQALSVVSTLSTLPVTLDADAMRWQGVAPRDPVSVVAKRATVEKLFEQIAGQRGMAAEIEKGQILITLTAEQFENARPEHYKLWDLCERGTTSADLAELAKKFVSPASWEARGGSGTIEMKNDGLTVSQLGAVHAELAFFFEKLRAARELPPQSKIDAKRLTLATAYEQARPALAKKVSVNFHEATPLMEILERLSANSGLDILVDRRALAVAGMSDKMEVSYSAEKKPLETVLFELLRPLKLGYRPLDARTLEVAPLKELDRRTDCEFYPAARFIASGMSGQELIDRVRKSVVPASWPNHGQIYYDPPSKSLIVSQSPAVHAAIFCYLAEKPAKK